MPRLPCSQSWLMQGPRSRFLHRHGGVQLIPGQTQLDTIQPVVGNWNEKDLREQFHDCLRDQNKFPDVMRAEKLLGEMRLRQAEFTLSELALYEEILTSAKEHETLAKSLVEIGKDGKPGLAESALLMERARLFQARLTEPRPPITAEVGTLLTNERAHYGNRLLGLSRDSLREQYDGLIHALHSTHEGAEALEDVAKTAVRAFRDKSLSADQLVKEIDQLEARFARIEHENHHMKPQYLALVPSMKNHDFYSVGAGSETEELRRQMRLRRLLKTYAACAKETRTIRDLEKRLRKDYAGKQAFDMVKGAVIKVKGADGHERTARILETKGDPQKPNGRVRVKTAAGNQWMEPGELYFTLLMEGGHRCDPKEEMVAKNLTYIPSVETLEGLQKAMGWDPEKQPLKGPGGDDVAVISKKISSQVIIGKVDESARTLAVAYNHNPTTKQWEKMERMDFQRFYEFAKKYDLKYAHDKPERTWDATYWNRIKTTKPTNTRSNLSIAGIAKGIKMVGEAFKRMGSERTEINGANFARWASKKVEGFTDALGIPWTHGVADAVQNSAIDLIMGKIDKWATEYKKLLKTNEMEAAFADFYRMPKWRQAALLLAAGEKGLSKPEVIHLLRGEGIDPSKWDNKKPVTHNDYVGLLYNYFADEGDASGLPKKIESRMTPVLNSSYPKNVKVGYEESVMNFEFGETMDLYRSYFAKPVYENGKLVRIDPNATKRERAMGPIQSALKLGIDANQLGRMVVWMYSTVESSTEGPHKMYSNFHGSMMRQIGNTGKYLIPMMGLYRFPRGMALARAMIDFYTECSGESPYDYKKGEANDAEITLGYLFAGQWNMVEDKIKARIGEENANRLKYMYMKARAFCYHMEEGAGLSLHLPAGADLDEDTLTDAYGVSGMLSRSWLATVMKTDESGSGAADHHNWVYAERAGQWWDQLPNKIKEVTPTEQKLFAHNFWEILYEDIAVRSELFRRHWKSIGPIMKYMTPGEGPVVVEFAGSPNAQRVKVEFDSKDPHLVERIDEALHHRQHEDPGTYIADLHLNAHSWLEKTKGDIGRDPKDSSGLGLVFRDTVNKLQTTGIGEFITDGKGGLYNLDIVGQIKKEIDESKTWKSKVGKLAQETEMLHLLDRKSVRDRIGAATGDNFSEDPSLSGGYSESSD